jgi:hypothetical protein
VFAFKSFRPAPLWHSRHRRKTHDCLKQPAAAFAAW